MDFVLCGCIFQLLSHKRFFGKNYISLGLKLIHSEISYSVCTRIVDVKPRVENNGLNKSNLLFVNKQVGNHR